MQWGNSMPNRPVYLVEELERYKAKGPRAYRIMCCLNPECRESWLGQPGSYWNTQYEELKSEWLEK